MTGELPISAQTADRAPIALYIHWPFCAAKCPYCDFNSHVRDTIDQDDWCQALLTELKRVTADLAGWPLSSIFFGGGTPSLMPPATAAALIDAATALFSAPDDLEITLEANPTSVEASRFAAFQQAGVNRVSVGVQALDDDDLKFLGRWHSAAEAMNAVDTARSVFERVSFDLIYARPEQSLEDWAVELNQALQFDPDHLSLYQLTIEPGTAFYQRYKRGQFTLPSEDLAADLFDMTQTVTANAGLPAYEISNHAKAGQACQHNLVYWQGGYYAGIGPGAHGRLPGPENSWMAQFQIKSPEKWLKAVHSGNGDAERTPTSPEERFTEMLMMGLRLKEGVSLSTLGTAADLCQANWPINRKAIEDLNTDGFLHRNGDRISLTDKGWPLLNPILTALAA